jgi:hypothetical protein
MGIPQRQADAPLRNANLHGLYMEKMTFVNSVTLQCFKLKKYRTQPTAVGGSALYIGSVLIFQQ